MGIPSCNVHMMVGMRTDTTPSRSVPRGGGVIRHREMNRFWIFWSFVSWASQYPPLALVGGSRRNIIPRYRTGSDASSVVSVCLGNTPFESRETISISWSGDSGGGL